MNFLIEKVYSGTYSTCINRRIIRNANTKKSWRLPWLLRDVQNFTAIALSVDITVVVAGSRFPRMLFPICSGVPHELATVSFVLWGSALLSMFFAGCSETRWSTWPSWSVLSRASSAHQMFRHDYNETNWCQILNIYKYIKCKDVLEISICFFTFCFLNILL